MKNLVLYFALCLTTISTTTAQWNSKKVRGNGEMVTQTRNTSDYEKIQVVGFIDVKLVSGNEGYIQVAAESNLQQYITTNVSDGILKISIANNINFTTKKGLLVTVPVKTVNEISLTGNGDVWTEDKIKSNHMKISVTGSGDMNLELETRNLMGQVTGSGDIKIKGETEKLECTVTGSGDFDAFQLRANSVEAKVSGSGDVMVYAISSLKASVNGSGDVVYKGNPENQNFKTNGSGDISSY